MSILLSFPVYIPLRLSDVTPHLLSSFPLSPGVSSFASIPPFNNSWGVRTVWLSLLTNRISLSQASRGDASDLHVAHKSGRSNRYGAENRGLYSRLTLIVWEGGAVRRTEGMRRSRLISEQRFDQGQSLIPASASSLRACCISPLWNVSRFFNACSHRERPSGVYTHTHTLHEHMGEERMEEN